LYSLPYFEKVKPIKSVGRILFPLAFGSVLMGIYNPYGKVYLLTDEEGRLLRVVRE